MQAQHTRVDEFFSQPSALQVSAGQYHTCVIVADGSAQCFGDNAAGQCTVPLIGERWVHISAGGWHTCGVTERGRGLCWGSSGSGRSDVPFVDAPWLVLSAGRYHTCGVLINGTALCWGGNANGQTLVPHGADHQGWRTVTAAFWRTCGILSNGTGLCWGSAFYGENDIPAVPGTWAVLSPGRWHSCGILQNGRALCWGSSEDGKRQVPDVNTRWIDIVAGQDHSCGVGENYEAHCWGSDADDRASPGSLAFLKVSSRYFHGCGRTFDGGVRCWGSSTYGRTTVPTLPVRFVTMSGTETLCALTSEGKAECWGRNDYDQDEVPASITKWSMVAAASFHACGIVSGTGELQCWGSDSDGRATVPSTGEDAVAGWKSVSVGNYHTCGITASSNLLCWGTDVCGETQVPNIGDEPTGRTRWSRVIAGRFVTCGTTANGTTMCWGCNDAGHIPPSLSQPPGPRSLALGYFHGCAIVNTEGTNAPYNSGGPLLCWGNNQQGQLNVPTLSAGLSWMAVSCSQSVSCGLTSNGSVLCWGASSTGQLNVPDLPAGRHWVAVEALLLDVCGIVDTGDIHCWGANSNDLHHVPPQFITRSTHLILQPGPPSADVEMTRQQHSVFALAEDLVCYTTPPRLNPPPPPARVQAVLCTGNATAGWSGDMVPLDYEVLALSASSVMLCVMLDTPGNSTLQCWDTASLTTQESGAAIILPFSLPRTPTMSGDIEHSTPLQLSVANHTVCAVYEAIRHCWSLLVDLQEGASQGTYLLKLVTPSVDGPEWVFLSSSGAFFYGLTVDGRVWLDGADDNLVDAPLNSSRNLRHVALRIDASGCIISGEGALGCWEMGDSTPQPMQPDREFLEVAVPAGVSLPWLKTAFFGAGGRCYYALLPCLILKGSPTKRAGPR